MNKVLFWIAAIAIVLVTILGGAGYSRAIVIWPLLPTPYVCMAVHFVLERRRAKRARCIWPDCGYDTNCSAGGTWCCNKDRRK
jgi:hypothetical protein